MAAICVFCEGSGYLDINEYCDCDAGSFYEGRDEIRLQIQYDVLDIGQDSIDYELRRLEAEYNAYCTMKLFNNLPFAYNEE